MSTIKAGTTSTTAYQVEADTTGELVFKTGASATTALTINSSQAFTFDGAAVFNESGADKDFRVESDTDANCLFVDASANAVGIGTSSPTYKFHVAGTGGYVARFDRTATTSGLDIGADSSGAILQPFGVDAIQFYNAAGTTRNMLLNASGNLGLGVTPSAWGSSNKVFQISGGGAFWSPGAVDTRISNNQYRNSSNSRIYIADGAAHEYAQNSLGHVWFTAASGTAGNTITFTQAMTLTDLGDLLIGTTGGGTALTVVARANAPVASFDSPSAGYAYMALRYNGTAYGYFGQASAMLSGASNTDLAIRSENALLFASGGGTERARITSGGELLVGKTISDETTIGTRISEGSNSCSNAGTANFWVAFSTSAAAYRFYVTNAGTVFATNTTISSISDIRLKENVRDLDVGLDAVMALKPRKFDWKEGKGQDKKDVRGFIAQEFEQVFPDLIDEWKDPAPEGEEPYKSVRQDLIPVLVKAIQEQQAMIDELKAEVAALKAG